MVLCDYCQQPAALVGGAAIYPHRPDLARKLFWLCDRDDAWVGCHPGGSRPLGRLANTELRQAKIEAHAAFDPLWRDRAMTRRQAYQWLAEQLGIDSDDCHIGMFDVETCRRVVAVCEAREKVKD